MLNIGFLSHYPFLKILFPSFLYHHCLQFQYPTNFLVRECFSLLVGYMTKTDIRNHYVIWSAIFNRSHGDKKFRKQVIKTFSRREGWWYIGIKGDGGIKSKGTRFLIEKEK